jgi:hypothetical protein
LISTVSLRLLVKDSKNFVHFVGTFVVAAPSAALV